MPRRCRCDERWRARRSRGCAEGLSARLDEEAREDAHLDYPGENEPVATVERLDRSEKVLEVLATRRVEVDVIEFEPGVRSVVSASECARKRARELSSHQWSQKRRVSQEQCLLATSPMISEREVVSLADT